MLLGVSEEYGFPCSVRIPVIPTRALQFRAPGGMQYAAAAAALRAATRRRLSDTSAIAQATAASAAAMAAAAEGGVDPRLRVECVTLPGCVQLVVVAEGPQQVRPTADCDGASAPPEAAADDNSKGSAAKPTGAGCDAGSGLDVSGGALPTLGQLPPWMWMQPSALWAAAAQAAADAGLEPMCDPQLQVQLWNGRNGQCCDEQPPCGPALLYAEPPVLPLTAFADSGSSMPEATGDIRAVAVDFWVPPDVAAIVTQQQQQQQQTEVVQHRLEDRDQDRVEAGGGLPDGDVQTNPVTSNGGTDGGSVATVHPPAPHDWQLVVMATVEATSQASEPLQLRLYPPEDATAVQPAADTKPQVLRRTLPPGAACRAGASGPSALPDGQPLRLQLPASLPRGLGLQDRQDTVAPCDGCCSCAQLLPTAATPFTTAVATAVNQVPVATAALPSEHGGRLGSCTCRCGRVGGDVNSGSAGALLQLHLLAVPRDALRPSPPPPAPAGSCQGGSLPPPPPQGRTKVCGEGSASAADGSPAAAPVHSLPQAVWLGSAPLLLAPPGPAGELAELWERAKGEGAEQNAEGVGVGGQGAEGWESLQQQRAVGGSWPRDGWRREAQPEPDRYQASSGRAMQHHMRPLLRDLAAALGQGQGMAEGVGARVGQVSAAVARMDQLPGPSAPAGAAPGPAGGGAAHSEAEVRRLSCLRAFLLAQGMCGCAEWLGRGHVC